MGDVPWGFSRQEYCSGLPFPSPGDLSYPGMDLCPWDSPGQSTGVGCHFLLQEIFPTQGSNPRLLCLLYWFFTTSATWEARSHVPVGPRTCCSQKNTRGAAGRRHHGRWHHTCFSGQEASGETMQLLAEVPLAEGRVQAHTHAAVFACGNTAPETVEHEYGTAAWDTGAQRDCLSCRSYGLIGVFYRVCPLSWSWSTSLNRAQGRV